MRSQMESNTCNQLYLKRSTARNQKMIKYTLAYVLLLSFEWAQVVICFSSRYQNSEPLFEEQGSSKKSVEIRKKDRCIVDPSSLNVTVDCANRNLTAIPVDLPCNTTILYLQNNNIARIRSGAFKNVTKLIHLDLSNNKIKELRNDCFSGLENLENLDLSFNKIIYSREKINDLCFQPLTKLRKLSFDQNFNHSSPHESFPFHALKHLKYLQKLKINGMADMSFATKSHSLPFLEHLTVIGNDGTRCNVSFIWKNMFKFTPRLKVLSIVLCNVQRIQNGSFSELTNLTSLNLSNNEELEFKNMENLTYGLTFTKIKHLNLTKIHSTFGGCVVLQGKHIKHLAQTKIESVILNSNRLSSLNKSAIDAIPKTLATLHLDDNLMRLEPYLIDLLIFVKQQPSLEIEEISVASQNMNHFGDFDGDTKHQFGRHLTTKTKRSILHHQAEQSGVSKANLSALNTLNSSHDTVDIGSYMYGLAHNNVACVAFPRKLKTIVFSKCDIVAYLPSFNICFPNQIQTLMLDGNLLSSLEGPYDGLYNLTFLDISSNFCENISFTYLHYMPKLKTFKASTNYLGFSLNKDKKGIFFSKSKALESLDLSENKIRRLHQNVFSGLVSLTTLVLSKNMLTDIDFEIGHMKNLSTFDLGDNFLDTLKENLRQSLDELSKTRPVALDLKHNTLRCNCKTLQFLIWMSKTEVNFIDIELYTCTFDNSSSGNLTYPHLENIITYLERECSSYTGYILATAGILMLMISVIIGGILYRYRWNLRYMYYSAKLKLQGYQALEQENNSYDHDVFISYSESETDFVRNVILQELEVRRGMSVLVHERDFKAGKSVYDNIVKAISSSKKTLVILTRNFLDSHWCCYEMHMARMEKIKTGRNVICVLKKEHVPLDCLPLEIIDIIRNQSYAELPKHEDQLEAFWDCLKLDILE